VSLEIRPITLRAAAAFIAQHHRHNKPPRGHKFSVAVYDGERLGVALPTTDADGRKDAADGVGVWMCLLRQRSPAIASRYDAALWGAKASVLI
jgi:hypothetical protein